MTRAEIHAQLAAVHAASDDPAQELLELQRLSEMVRRFTDEQRIRAAFPGVDPSKWPDEFSGRTTLADKGWW